ncbi:hypothetical protein MTR_6g464500 [Medicago truncatula]|uniref:Uncharacterized protein n=1 Tax=Medicago truncatula TaxID=3880 RepID=A0A072UAV0_MEDTR|nr:hypothetical protein MTR_6g464500 [Medicago truncatula]
MAAKPFTIPWIYLDDSNIPNRDPNQKPILKKSFSQALKNIRDIPHSQLLKTSLKGNEFAIPIPDEEYESGLEDHRNSLHARIMWRKGSTPLTVMALRAKLLSIWKNLVRWGITSLGHSMEKCRKLIDYKEKKQDKRKDKPLRKDLVVKQRQKCGNNWLTDKETEAENASEHPVQVPDGALDVNVQFEADVEKQNVDEHNIDDNNDDGLSDNGRIVNFASANSDDSKEDEFVENTQFDQQSAQGSSHKVTYSLDQSTPQRIEEDIHQITLTFSQLHNDRRPDPQRPKRNTTKPTWTKN